MMSVAEAWCVSTPSAHLALAVPTSVSAGKDSIVHNAHRIYGPLMYPFLVYTGCTKKGGLVDVPSLSIEDKA